jgi:methanogenic corrinoid protein MtbC1
MDQNERIDNLKNAMVALEKDDVVSNTAKCLEAGIEPLEIIENGKWIVTRPQQDWRDV